MSWTDKIAIDTINQLKDEFKVKHFVETGTFKGVNAEVQNRNFSFVSTCEIVPEFLRLAQKRLKDKLNVYIYDMRSVHFLKLLQSKNFNLYGNDITC